MQLLAAGLAATAVLSLPSIADAKVVIEQPKTKKARWQLSDWIRVLCCACCALPTPNLLTSQFLSIFSRALCLPTTSGSPKCRCSKGSRSLLSRRQSRAVKGDPACLQSASPLLVCPLSASLPLAFHPSAFLLWAHRASLVQILTLHPLMPWMCGRSHSQVTSNLTAQLVWHLQ